MRVNWFRLLFLGISLMVLTACGDDSSEKEGEEDDKTQTEEDGAEYAVALTYMKEEFCDCIAAGETLKDCEKNANESLKGIADHYDLEGSAEKELYTRAGDLMRQCIKK